MVYYFSLAGDQERINCLRPEDEIADLPNWFACGEFDNMEAAADKPCPRSDCLTRKAARTTSL